MSENQEISDKLSTTNELSESKELFFTERYEFEHLYDIEDSLPRYIEIWTKQYFTAILFKGFERFINIEELASEAYEIFLNICYSHFLYIKNDMETGWVDTDSENLDEEDNEIRNRNISEVVRWYEIYKNNYNIYSYGWSTELYNQICYCIRNEPLLNIYSIFSSSLTYFRKIHEVHGDRATGACIYYESNNANEVEDKIANEIFYYVCHLVVQDALYNPENNLGYLEAKESFEELSKNI